MKWDNVNDDTVDFDITESLSVESQVLKSRYKRKPSQDPVQKKNGNEKK
jgi:hypothetical protein